MSQVKALIEKRAKIWETAKEVRNVSLKEERDMSPEEKAQFDVLVADVEAIKAKIADETKVEELDSEMAAAEPRKVAHNGDTREVSRVSGKDAWRNYIRYGDTRNMSTTNNAGGFMVAPVDVKDVLIKAVDNAVFVRQLAHVEKLDNAVAIGVPSMTTDISDADWTTEIHSALSPDTSLVLARRDMVPNHLVKLVRASIKLLAESKNAEGFVNERLAYKFSAAQESGFLTGSGSGQPLGVFTASASGVPTSRDVAGTNTSSAMTAATMFDVKYSIKSQYYKSPGMRWVFHRDGVKQIMKLADSTGQYLWQPSLIVGQPDTLLGIPIEISEYAPNTFTTGLYVGLLGDFSQYWVVDLDVVFIQRLVERYADLGEIGFIGRMFCDGAPVLAEAFSRIKLG